MILPLSIALAVIAVLWLTRPPDPLDQVPVDEVETQENEEPPADAYAPEAAQGTPRA